MADWLWVILACVGVAYGLYAGYCRRQAEQRLRIIAKDWQRLAQRYAESKEQLAEIEEKQAWAAERDRIMRRFHGVA